MRSNKKIHVISAHAEGEVGDVAEVGHHPAIVPKISGRGWVTGIHQHMLDPTDLWPEGHKLTYTWGV